MSTTELVSRPRNIGEIFFSGSQSVAKGVQVTWILDETWAFKTTEPCGVSQNGSPFVQLQTGETFIIYKRTQADIDAGNLKGIYVFDRDTVVALAYPQEVTQDIIIENDIYNDNKNIITIEADQTPTVVLSGDTTATVGDTVTVTASVNIVAPAVEASREWKRNGVTEATSGDTFQYTADSAGIDQIQLFVTDDNGRMGYDAHSVVVAEYIPPGPITFATSDQAVAPINEGVWTPIFVTIADQDAISADCILKFSAGIGTAWSASLSRHGPDSLDFRLMVDGVERYAKTFNTNAPDGSVPNTFIEDTAIGNFTINSGDTIQLEVYWTDTWEYAGAHSVCQAGCINGDLEVVAQPQ